MNRVGMLVLLVAGTGAFAQTDPGQGSIDGSVIDSVTRIGIPGVAVTFYTSQGVQYQSTTDGAGKFLLSGMQNGSYRSTIEKEGFELPQTDGLPRETTTKVDGKDPVKVTVEMIPWATLRGRVLDEEGKPVAGAKVQLRGTVPRPREDAVTAGDGSFEFGKLPPGSVTLLAKPKPVKNAAIQQVSTYFPSEIDSAQAQMITIRPGMDQASFDIRLRRAPVYRLKGVVLDEAGKPAEKINVRLGRMNPLTPVGTGVVGNTLHEYTFGRAFQLEDEGVVTKADGIFEFPSVREGDWVLQAESEYEYQPQTKRDLQLIGEAQAFVSRRDVDDLEIRLSRTFDVQATVEWEGQTRAPANFFAPLALRPVDSTGRIAGGTVKADGAVQFKGVNPGRYTVASVMSLASEYYVGSVVMNGQEMLGQTIQLGPGAAPMHIVYKKGAGSIRGMIDKGQAATVLLLPAGPGIEWVRSMEVAAGAAFATASLRPGDYSIAAFDRVDSGTKAAAHKWNFA